MNITEIVLTFMLAFVLAWLIVYVIGKKSKPLVRPRKPTPADLVWYLILIFFLNLVGLFIVIILWNYNHVKKGEWWGWWDKQPTRKPASARRKKK